MCNITKASAIKFSLAMHLRMLEWNYFLRMCSNKKKLNRLELRERVDGCIKKIHNMFDDDADVEHHKNAWNLLIMARKVSFKHGQQLNPEKIGRMMRCEGESTWIYFGLFFRSWTWFFFGKIYLKKIWIKSFNKKLGSNPKKIIGNFRN